MVELLVFLRLAWLGLLRDFKVFAFFLLFDAARTIVLMSWDYHSHFYEHVWSISAPIETFLIFLVVLELSHRIQEPFPGETGNRTTGLFAFLIGLTVSLGISMATHPQLINRPLALLTGFANRCVLTGCVLGLLAQGTYLIMVSAPLLANIKLHRRVLLVFMTVAVISSFTISLTHPGIDIRLWTRVLRSFIHLGCFCAWGLGFRRMFSDLWDYEGCNPWNSRDYPTDAQLAEVLVYKRRHRLALEATAAAAQKSRNISIS